MELLAPAGSWESFIAAIENGADAVYLGGQDFSARKSAANFSLEEIRRAAEYAHLRQRKIFVTVNTLIDRNEFPAALDFIWELYQLNIDAVIVQDLGLMKAIRTLLPALNIHASTQMTVHNLAGAQFLFEQGIKRIVLAREMSLNEISAISQEIRDGELEVFVHGAMCYSFSGQCLFSSIVGGRSGNRGRCAQPCRLSYQLIAGEFPSAAQGYLLSPADLCLIDMLPQLGAAGVKSLKIEGRMKRPEYVAVVTRAYREVLDRGSQDATLRADARERLLKIFNRNFSTGYLLPGQDGFLSPLKPNNRGIPVGRVVSQDASLKTRIKLTDSLSVGDGLEIWVSRGKTPAFVVNEIRIDGFLVQKATVGQTVELPANGRAAAGDRVFKTHDEELINQAVSSIKENQHNKIALDARVSLVEGEPLELTVSDERGNTVIVKGKSAAQTAEKHPLDIDTLRDKIGRLGNTAFWLRDLELYCEGRLMVPFSEINELRRQAIEQLTALNLQAYILPEVNYNIFKANLTKHMQIGSNKKKSDRLKGIVPKLSIVVSGAAEAYSAVRAGADRVYLSLEAIGRTTSIRKAEWIELNKYGQVHGCRIIPALPGIQMIGEEDDWDEILQDSSIMMAANLGALKRGLDQNIKVLTDYSLNVFNPYSLKYLIEAGAEGVCLSPELSWLQLESFGSLEKCEIVVHGELIIMVSRYCMLNGVLGNEEKKCPAFCRQKECSIKDEKGYEFPLATDRYCRFYVFNSRTMCMADEMDRIVALGPEAIRIEARRGDEKQVSSWVGIYRSVLDELADGNKPDLEFYKAELAKTSPSAFSKYHYHRGVL